MSNTENMPRVWVGCLGCYNEGRLVGEWCDADEVADLTVKDIHATGGRHHDFGHEELWVFDHENIPDAGEMDLSTAAEWGERYEEVTGKHHEWAAFMAYVRMGGHGHGVPDFDHFEDSYAGEYGTMRAYAEDFVRAVYPLGDVPDIILDNVDWDLVAQDLEQDHTESDGHIFRAV